VSLLPTKGGLSVWKSNNDSNNNNNKQNQAFSDFAAAAA